MGTLLDDLTLAHDDDLVSSDDSAQSVCDDDHGLLAVLKQLIERFLDLVLTFGVQGTRGLIQEQDAWFANQGSSDSNALLLSAGEATTSLTNHRFNTQLELSFVL